MEIIATQKYLRASPQKLRLVVRGIKGIDDPERVLTTLAFIRKRAAQPLAKTIKQALANARNKGLTGVLRVKEIQIGDGPRFKRFRAGPRGMARPILKRTSHIRVILETESQEKSKHEARNPKPALPAGRQIKNSPAAPSEAGRAKSK